MTKLMILRWGGHPGLLRLAPWNRRRSHKKERGRRVGTRERDGRMPCMPLALKIEGGPAARNEGSFQKLEKARDKLSPKASRRNVACQHCDFSPVRLI